MSYSYWQSPLKKEVVMLNTDPRNSDRHWIEVIKDSWTQVDEETYNEYIRVRKEEYKADLIEKGCTCFTAYKIGYFTWICSVHGNVAVREHTNKFIIYEDIRDGI